MILPKKDLIKMTLVVLIQTATFNQINTNRRYWWRFVFTLKIKPNIQMKNALITGATSGIGYELAKRFAEEEYNLILVARNKENLKKTAGEMQAISPAIKIHLIAVDLFERDAAVDIYKKIKKLGIIVNVLVNNAGQGEWGKFTKTDLEREISIIELNIISTVSLTKYYLKEMVKRKEGKILLLASSISKIPGPYMSVYGATKSFILSFAEALAEEVKDTGVTIAAIQPDATDTDFFHKAKAENTIVYKEKTLQSPEEVANAAFRGLMNNEHVIVPGLSNKIQKAMNTIMPDTAIAVNMAKQMKPSKQKEGRRFPLHSASLRERESINNHKNETNGDY
jgi:short-subunit dehydrogenase